jgi:hypothetical protein
VDALRQGLQHFLLIRFEAGFVVLLNGEGVPEPGPEAARLLPRGWILSCSFSPVLLFTAHGLILT